MRGSYITRNASNPISEESPGVLYQDLFEKTLEAQLADLEKKLRELPEYKTMDRKLTQQLIERLKDKIRIQDAAEVAREELDSRLETVKKDFAETPESRPALRELRLLMVQRLENEIRVQDGIEPEPIQPSEGIARRALQEAKEARAGLLTPIDPPQRESVSTNLELPPMPIVSSDEKGQPIGAVQTRTYRWGKFQGWTMIVVGLLNCIPINGLTTTEGLIIWLGLLTAGVTTVFLGIGLLRKRRYGLILMYVSIVIIALGIVRSVVSLVWGLSVILWFLIPALFYYPKRRSEFSRNAPEDILTAKPSADMLKSSNSTLLDKLKSAGGFLLGIIIILALLTVCAVFIAGVEWLSENLLPWSLRVSEWAFFVPIALLLPLSLVQKCRSYTPTAMIFASLVFGATVWMDGLVLTMTIWGDGAAIFGLLLGGVGVVPFAMLATLFHGMWARLAELVVLIVLTFGSRFLAFWIGGMAESDE